MLSITVRGLDPRYVAGTIAQCGACRGSKVSRVVKARDMSPMDQKSSFEPRSFSLLLVVLSTPPDFYFWAGTHA